MTSGGMDEAADELVPELSSIFCRVQGNGVRLDDSTCAGSAHPTDMVTSAKFLARYLLYSVFPFGISHTQ